ncbi:MAG: type VII secretion protein EccE [Kineosporiaceae bacterium]
MRRPAPVPAGLVRVVMVRVVVVEAVVLLVVLAWPGSWWWRGPVLVLAVLTGAVLLGRARGRPLSAWSAVLLAFLGRRRRAGRDATLRLLGDPAAALAVETHVDRAGTRFGLVRDAASWTSLLALEPPGDDWTTAPGPATVPLGRLLAALEIGDVRPAAVHVLLRVLPAPSPRVDPRSPVATSYREVSDGVVAQRSLLVGLRLEPARSPRAVTDRGGGDPGARRAIAAATARLAADLGDVARARVLGPEDVRAAVGAGLGVAPGPAVETWRGVDHGRDGVQVCYGVHGWGPDPTALLSRLSSLPGVLDVVSLSRQRGGEPAAVLRVLCLAEDLDAVHAAIARTTLAGRARIRRLDGAHGPGTVGTLPAVRARHPSRPPDGPPRAGSPPWADGLRLPLTRGGLVLGRGPAGGPVPLELFLDRPSALAAVLDPRVVMVIGFRALAVGARVSVVSTRAERWLPLRRLGVDDAEVVGIFSPETASLPTAAPRPDRPHLVVVDLPDRADPPRITGRPWQCVISVVPELSLRTLPAARAVGTVLMRRLTRREAIAATPFLGLAGGSDRQLTELGDEQVAVAAAGRLTVVDLGLTGAESQLVVASTGVPVRSAAPPARPGVQAEDDAQQRQQRGHGQELGDVEEPAGVG